MSSTDIVIRESTAADQEAIAEMAAEAVDDGRVYVFEDVADFIDYWQQAGALSFVAARGAEVLGTYVLKPNQKGRGAHVANAGYLVHSAARGLGVGTLMGRHSIDKARELGYAAMQFNMVVATNANAIHVWEKLGFNEVGRLPGVFRHKTDGMVDALVMHRFL